MLCCKPASLKYARVSDENCWRVRVPIPFLCPACRPIPTAQSIPTNFSCVFVAGVPVRYSRLPCNVFYFENYPGHDTRSTYPGAAEYLVSKAYAIDNIDLSTTSYRSSTASKVRDTHRDASAAVMASAVSFAAAQQLPTTIAGDASAKNLRPGKTEDHAEQILLLEICAQAKMPKT